MNNVTDIYNTTKYQKQYGQYHQVVLEFKNWQKEHIYGKPVISVKYYDGYYAELLYDGGRNLENDLMGNGYIFIPKKWYETMNRQSTILKNRGIKEGNDAIKYAGIEGLKRADTLWELQQEAKKNKRGIWSIEFNN
ncbi:hypothetical protein [Methanococcus aeolicus]|uniref:hypothetical protein n=1 Tax=Methanococcus aeolicus TaxID=42879 RepID=UPI0021C83261|nr:hypothetical protein [Methanococcus aeolicus]UXM85071.1 hypothetical protein N6C89_01975 [Methanococcus aeolicus]